MWLTIVSITIIVLLAGLLLRKSIRSEKRLKETLAISEKRRQEALKEAALHQRQRLIFERALALPMASKKERDQELWVRALRGDELAELILQEAMFDFTSGDQLPLVALSSE